jgi:hypothetical protein
MSKVTLKIPMIAALGPLQPAQISRDFQGMMPASGSVSFVARIIRDGLETARYPEYRKLIALSDDYLVEQVALVTAVPDDIWIRNGLVPLSEWEPDRP